jgi:CcmD family protein
MERLNKSKPANPLRALLFVLLTTLSPLLQAQDMDVPMADTFRAEGKIYVVVAVMLVIFSGLVTYLIYVDRKVSKLEREMREKDTE